MTSVRTRPKDWSRTRDQVADVAIALPGPLDRQRPCPQQRSLTVAACTTNDGLVFNACVEARREAAERVVLEAPLLRDIAASIKTHLSVPAVVQPQGPFVVEHIGTTTASLTSPCQISTACFGLVGKPLAFLLFDRRDRKVQARKVAPF